MGIADPRSLSYGGAAERSILRDVAVVVDRESVWPTQ